MNRLFRWMTALFILMIPASYALYAAEATVKASPANETTAKAQTADYLFVLLAHKAVISQALPEFPWYAHI